MEKQLKFGESYGDAIKHRIIEWLLDTDFHGLPRIPRQTRLLIRIIWIVSFFLSAGTCGFLVVRTIEGYLQYDVYSKYDVMHETAALFPTVTICNQNPFATDEAFGYVERIMKENNITFESIENMNDSKGYKSLGLKLKQDIANVRFLALLNTDSSNGSETLKRSLGLTKQEFVISCEYETNECSDDDFEWYFDSWYGNCFQYGKKTPKFTTRAGNYDGLIMQLFVGLGQPESNFSTSMRSGAHIMIHNQTIWPSSFGGKLNRPIKCIILLW